MMSKGEEIKSNIEFNCLKEYIRKIRPQLPKTERLLVQQWVKKLQQPQLHNRTAYISRMYAEIIHGYLCPPFSVEPPEGELEPLPPPHSHTISEGCTSLSSMVSQNTSLSSGKDTKLTDSETTNSRQTEITEVSNEGIIRVRSEPNLMKSKYGLMQSKYTLTNSRQNTNDMRERTMGDGENMINGDGDRQVVSLQQEKESGDRTDRVEFRAVLDEFNRENANKIKEQEEHGVDRDEFRRGIDEFKRENTKKITVEYFNEKNPVASEMCIEMQDGIETVGHAGMSRNMAGPRANGRKEDREVSLNENYDETKNVLGANAKEDTIPVRTEPKYLSISGEVTKVHDLLKKEEPITTTDKIFSTSGKYERRAELQLREENQENEMRKTEKSHEYNLKKKDVLGTSKSAEKTQVHDLLKKIASLYQTRYQGKVIELEEKIKALTLRNAELSEVIRKDKAEIKDLREQFEDLQRRYSDGVEVSKRNTNAGDGDAKERNVPVRKGSEKLSEIIDTLSELLGKSNRHIEKLSSLAIKFNLIKSDYELERKEMILKFKSIDTLHQNILTELVKQRVNEGKEYEHLIENYRTQFNEKNAEISKLQNNACDACAKRRASCENTPNQVQQLRVQVAHLTHMNKELSYNYEKKIKKLMNEKQLEGKLMNTLLKAQKEEIEIYLTGQKHEELRKLAENLESQYSQIVDEAIKAAKSQQETIVPK